MKSDEAMMNTHMEYKMLYGIAIFSLAMNVIVVLIGLRFPHASALIPAALAFATITAFSGIVARVASGMNKRLQQIEDAMRVNVQDRS